MEQKHEEISIITMEIEQYDNGIAINMVECGGERTKQVCYDHDISSTIGKVVWAEAQDMMNLVTGNQVKIEMKFITNEGK